MAGPLLWVGGGGVGDGCVSYGVMTGIGGLG